MSTSLQARLASRLGGRPGARGAAQCHDAGPGLSRAVRARAGGGARLARPAQGRSAAPSGVAVAVAGAVRGARAGEPARAVGVRGDARARPICRAASPTRTAPDRRSRPASRTSCCTCACTGATIVVRSRGRCATAAACRCRPITSRSSAARRPPRGPPVRAPETARRPSLPARSTPAERVLDSPHNLSRGVTWAKATDVRDAARSTGGPTARPGRRRRTASLILPLRPQPQDRENGDDDVHEEPVHAGRITEHRTGSPGTGAAGDRPAPEELAVGQDAGEYEPESPPPSEWPVAPAASSWNPPPCDLLLGEMLGP